MCLLLVGLPDVAVLGVDDAAGEPVPKVQPFKLVNKTGAPRNFPNDRPANSRPSIHRICVATTGPANTFSGRGRTRSSALAVLRWSLGVMLGSP